MKLPDLSFAGFEYDHCDKKIKYSILHQTKPIELSREMTKIIEYLLWYVPNINSLQSSENELVESLEFDNFTFGIIKSYMGLQNKDVAFLDYIDPKIVHYYHESLCPNQEKLLLTRQENESKTSAVLRHVRNAIAHGYFNIVEDLFIGFDFKTNAREIDECSAIIKIKPGNLLKGLQALDEEVTAEKLAVMSLQQTGYYVERFHNKNGSAAFDFFVKKDQRKYAVEVKKYKDHDILPQDEINRLVAQFENVHDHLTPVLFINTSQMTKKSKNQLLQENVILLDIKNIKKMLDGRDMLEEIEKAGRREPYKKPKN